MNYPRNRFLAVNTDTNNSTKQDSERAGHIAHLDRTQTETWIVGVYLYISYS